ncbi:MAG: hypothetical protein JWO92_531 [Chitinophagaceae bacterium]|nr:hypothetical protein [Chitinophagaceae bacterium]
MASYQINIVSSHKIDKAKWDKCIAASSNGLIYAYSCYLNGMSKHWDALILNDYEVVMPLIWNKKYSISYLYQPHFLRAIGIFGEAVSTELVNLFLAKAADYCKYWDIDFKENIITPQTVSLKRLHFRKRKNFLLTLDKKYTELHSNYKRLAHRMLKKAVENNIEIVRNCSVAEVINFYKKNYKEQQNIKQGDYERLLKAAELAIKNKNAVTYKATKSTETVAVYMVLKDEKFIYSLIGGSNKKGKNYGAFYLLTDAAIKDHADSNRTFRFEGSDKPGIAFFNAQFNPELIYYYRLKLNRLPWLVRLFKK